MFRPAGCGHWGLKIMPTFHLPHQCSARLQALTNKPTAMAGRGTGQGSMALKKAAVPTPHQATPTTSIWNNAAAAQVKCCTRGGKSQIAAPIPLPVQEPVVSTTKLMKKLAVNIVWEGGCMDQFVNWITSHMSDHHILFHDCSASTSIIKPRLETNHLERTRRTLQEPLQSTSLEPILTMPPCTHLIL